MLTNNIENYIQENFNISTLIQIWRAFVDIRLIGSTVVCKFINCLTSIYFPIFTFRPLSRTNMYQLALDIMVSKFCLNRFSYSIALRLYLITPSHFLSGRLLIILEQASRPCLCMNLLLFVSLHPNLWYNIIPWRYMSNHSIRWLFYIWPVRDGTFCSHSSNGVGEHSVTNGRSIVQIKQCTQQQQQQQQQYCHDAGCEALRTTKNRFYKTDHALPDKSRRVIAAFCFYCVNCLYYFRYNCGWRRNRSKYLFNFFVVKQKMSSKPWVRSETNTLLLYDLPNITLTSPETLC